MSSICSTALFDIYLKERKLGYNRSVMPLALQFVRFQNVGGESPPLKTALKNGKIDWRGRQVEWS